MLTRREVEQDVRLLFEALDPDVICLQEVWRRDEIHESDLERLCDGEWNHRCFGRNAVFPNGSQGNAILSRYAIEESDNIDISISGKEPRGLLYAHVRVDDTLVSIVNAHFGLFWSERRRQLGMLGEFLRRHAPLGPCVVAGDFNDWHRRLGAGFAALGFEEAHASVSGKLPLTFPSPLPFLSLDRLYFSGLSSTAARVVRDRRWFFSSDHLPYVADFRLPLSGT
jgi:endonuclease/exonuclease/phosphatase family metal-dependent hydrolase